MDFIAIALIAFLSLTSIGPVNLLAVKYGVVEERTKVFNVIIGMSIIEALYANLAGMGVELIHQDMRLRMSMLFVGAVFFFVAGIMALIDCHKLVDEEEIKKEKLPPFIAGMALSAPNPFIFIFWSGALASFHIATYHPLFISVSIGTVSLLWISAIMLFARTLKKLFEDKTLKIIQTAIAAVLLILGLKFSLDLLAIIFSR